jgi:hypothetical protein
MLCKEGQQRGAPERRRERGTREWGKGRRKSFGDRKMRRMEACYGGTDVIERSCAMARGLDINIEATGEGRHDTTRGGHSGRGPH